MKQHVTNITILPIATEVEYPRRSLLLLLFAEAIALRNMKKIHTPHTDVVRIHEIVCKYLLEESPAD